MVMEIVMLIAVPLITSLLAPLALEIVRKKINQRKDDAEAKRSEFASVLDADKHNDQVAAELRQELRSENVALKERNSDLERQVRESAIKAEDAARWEAKFYALKKEKQTLEFELTLVRKELEQFRRQYEQYTEIRDRARRKVGEPND